eukprot:758018-Hanusia_phi.AAC.1
MPSLSCKQDFYHPPPSPTTLYSAGGPAKLGNRLYSCQLYRSFGLYYQIRGSAAVRPGTPRGRRSPGKLSLSATVPDSDPGPARHTQRH